MKTFTAFGLIFVCISCTINYDIVGKYRSPKNSNVFYFKKDSTYFYEFGYNHLYQHSQGRWEKINGNRITITSDIKSTIAPISVRSVDRNENSNNLISLDLNIQNSKSLKDYRCGVYINDEFCYFKRCDSISPLLITKPMKSFYFFFTKEPEILTTTAVSPPIYTNKYFPKTSDGNKVEIEINFNDSWFYYKSFDKDTVKVKRHSIKIYNSYKKRWEKISKVSDGLNIFSAFGKTLN